MEEKRTKFFIKVDPEDTDKVILLYRVQQLLDTNDVQGIYFTKCFLDGLLGKGEN